MAIVGPAGSGKTSCIGKFASNLVMNQKKAVKLITLDDRKVGGIDELASYGDLLNITVDDHTADVTIKEDADKIILVDTGSLPTTDDHLTSLKTEIDKSGVTKIISVISALTRTADAISFGLQMQKLGVTHLIVSMSDLTDCWGTALSIALETNIKIGLITSSPSGIGQLTAPDAAVITEKILGGAIN